MKTFLIKKGNEHKNDEALDHHDEGPRKEDQEFIRLQPEPTDPLGGLILSQGQPVLHFSYFIISQFFLSFAEVDLETKTNMCRWQTDIIGGIPQYEYRPADHILINNVNSIKWTHLMCFFLIQIAEYLNYTNLDAHFSVFMSITSCVLY